MRSSGKKFSSTSRSTSFLVNLGYDEQNLFYMRIWESFRSSDRAFLIWRHLQSKSKVNSNFLTYNFFTSHHWVYHSKDSATV